MLRISDTEINLGIYVSQRVHACSNSYKCLWFKRNNLFVSFLHQFCAEENCPVVIFRNRLEGDSPPFYAEALRLSRWRRIANAYPSDERKMGEKKHRKLFCRIDNLTTYGELITLAVHPLILATKEIPLLKSKEIERLRSNWSLEELEATRQKMFALNPAWIDRLESGLCYLGSSQWYSNAAFYLVYLFFKGLEKNELPDFRIMSKKEKAEFFSELVR